jgi:hypothetical protein
MNWNQLYEKADKKQRLEILIMFLKRIENPPHPLQPRDLVFPVLFVQGLIAAGTVWLPARINLVGFGVANLVLVGITMLPAVCRMEKR